MGKGRAGVKGQPDGAAALRRAKGCGQREAADGGEPRSGAAPKGGQRESRRRHAALRANAGGRGPRWRQGPTRRDGGTGLRTCGVPPVGPGGDAGVSRGARLCQATPPAPQDVPRPARWRSTGGNLSACPAFAVPASARGATAALRRAPGSSPGPSAAGRDGSAGLPRRRRSRERAQVAGAGGTRQAWLRVEALEVTRDTRGREGPRGMWMWSGVRVVRADASCAPRGGSAQRWSALAACDQGWCWPLAMAPRCRDARERRGVTDRPRSRAAVHAV